MKKKEQHYRVSDFENAIREGATLVRIGTAIYLPDSLYVKEIVGFVEQHDRGIRVTWNNKGEAFVANEKAPEFDINL